MAEVLQRKAAKWKRYNAYCHAGDEVPQEELALVALAEYRDQFWLE
jgi:hypothetical protein